MIQENDSAGSPPTKMLKTSHESTRIENPLDKPNADEANQDKSSSEDQALSTPSQPDQKGEAKKDNEISTKEEANLKKSQFIENKYAGDKDKEECQEGSKEADEPADKEVELPKESPITPADEPANEEVELPEESPTTTSDESADKEAELPKESPITPADEPANKEVELPEESPTTTSDESADKEAELPEELPITTVDEEQEECQHMEIELSKESLDRKKSGKRRSPREHKPSTRAGAMRKAREKKRRQQSEESEEDSESDEEPPSTSDSEGGEIEYQEEGGEESIERPDEDDEREEEVYEVEAICNHRLTKGKVTSYEVKWLGYDESLNTHEPAKNIHEDCPDICEQYWSEQPWRPANVPSVKKRKRETESVQTNKQRRAASNHARFSELARKYKLTADDIEHELLRDGYTWAYDKRENWLDNVNWDNVREIRTVQSAGKGRLLAYIDWKNEKKTVHLVEEIHEQAAKKVSYYYPKVTQKGCTKMRIE
ncbi:hypothetical protein DFQ28_006088 [Apophysomyces sp. BC1034]|nr:hypothetical protein DFQ28_006088 [Apophysomyces sp. BC1034]